MKKLNRSKSDRWIAGVCGGLGETYGIDPKLVRIITILLCFVTGVLPLAIVYVVAWIIVQEG